MGSISRKKPARLPRRHVNWVVFAGGGGAAVLAALGLWLDFQSGDVLPLWLMWFLMWTAIVSPGLVAWQERISRMPHSAQAVASMYATGAAFLLTLYASTNEWPSAGLMIALVPTVLYLGTSTVFLTLYIRTEEDHLRVVEARKRRLDERHRARMAETLVAFQQQLDELSAEVVALRVGRPGAPPSYPEPLLSRLSRAVKVIRGSSPENEQ